MMSTEKAAWLEHLSRRGGRDAEGLQAGLAQMGPCRLCQSFWTVSVLEALKCLKEGI